MFTAGHITSHSCWILRIHQLDYQLAYENREAIGFVNGLTINWPTSQAFLNPLYNHQPLTVHQFPGAQYGRRNPDENRSGREKVGALAPFTSAGSWFIMVVAAGISMWPWVITKQQKKRWVNIQIKTSLIIYVTSGVRGIDP